MIAGAILAAVSHRTEGLVAKAPGLSCRRDLIVESGDFGSGAANRQTAGAAEADLAGIGCLRSGGIGLGKRQHWKHLC
jgi:hypothetical protein